MINNPEDEEQKKTTRSSSPRSKAFENVQDRLRDSQPPKSLGQTIELLFKIETDIIQGFPNHTNRIVGKN